MANIATFVTSAPSTSPVNLQVDPQTGEFQSLDVKVFLPGHSDPACTIRRCVNLSFTKMEFPTAGDVVEAVGHKEKLSEDGIKLFSLWMTNGVLDLQIRPKCTLAFVCKKWSRWVEKYTHDSLNVSRPAEFQIRREAMVTKAQERKVIEEGCVRLLYAEAKDNVISGRYPTTIDDATTLAANCLQVTLGDFDAKKMVPGTVGDLIMRLIPARLHKSKRQVDWETSVFTCYSKLKGKSQLIARMLYLQYVRQWPVYGSIFYPACRNMPPNGYFELRTDNALIAVNTEGILIVDEDKHKIIFCEPFTHMSWLYSSDTVTLEYGSASSPESMTLITPQAHLVDRLAFEAVKRIERVDMKLKRIRAEQANIN